MCQRLKHVRRCLASTVSAPVNMDDHKPHIVSWGNHREVGDYCQVVASVIVFYELIATFPTEIEVIWRSNLMTFTSVLFLLNRYNTLLNAFLEIAAWPATHPICKLGLALSSGTNLISFLVLATAIVFGFDMVPLGTNLVTQKNMSLAVSEHTGELNGIADRRRMHI
ncbi:hypothetical protein OBBRIDRAFT_804035 [Obba rivulosa]|uniref:DUF6533 domain-containing protein n=1 Tax=Obba rivulosa TaxID=1052685 RepID=A0A8E2ATP2_9APHY|nr:hypothetical protein OBBRIDRAFT_804035 [Obba rivulosa]